MIWKKQEGSVPVLVYFFPLKNYQRRSWLCSGFEKILALLARIRVPGFCIQKAIDWCVSVLLLSVLPAHVGAKNGNREGNRPVFQRNDAIVSDGQLCVRRVPDLAK